MALNLRIGVYRGEEPVWEGVLPFIGHETQIVWDDLAVPPGVIRQRDGKTYLDERELTPDVVAELGGKIQHRWVTPWEDA